MDVSKQMQVTQIMRTELDPNELKRYLSTMVTEYDKLVIGEYNRELGRKEGREEGLELGLKKGRKEGTDVVVRKMLAADVPMERISEWTGLTKAEIEALKN